MLELHILMGLNCNFRCSHCINGSRPVRKDTDLSERDIQKLVNEINESPEVRYISFSGGEPILYLEQIKQIVHKVRKVRKDIVFSITSNGSLVEKKLDELNELQIDHCVLSFDTYHSEFITSSLFLNAINASLKVFRNVELNVVYEDTLDVSDLRELLVEKKIKVNFNKLIRPVEMDRFDSANRTQFKIVSCPNVGDNFTKVSYIGGKGYTVCCGPVVFEGRLPHDLSYFKNLSDLQENKLFKALVKLKSAPLPLAEDEISCHSCTKVFSDVDSSTMNMFLSSNNWDNVITSWDTDSLHRHNRLFNPKYIKKVDKTKLSNYLVGQDLMTAKLDFEMGDFLSQHEIGEFSDFTIQSFYDVHLEHYHSSDIEKFKQDQNVFFALPYKFVRHSLDGNIVGYLVVCKLESHTFFNEPVWHIGYWGTSPGLDHSLKQQIKKKWGELLAELNANSAIVANIDFFNVSADKMSEKFGFKTYGVRLDSRS